MSCCLFAVAVTFFAVEFLFALLLAGLSFLTSGKGDPPGWNGMEYLVFCIREGLLIGAPFAALASLISGSLVLLAKGCKTRTEQRK